MKKLKYCCLKVKQILIFIWIKILFDLYKVIFVCHQKKLYKYNLMICTFYVRNAFIIAH